MSTSESDRSVITVLHERTRDYRTEFVNGVATMGPLADGTFRLTFFRDAIAPITELFDSVPGQPKIVDGSRPHPIEARVFREDFITIVVSPEIALKIGSDLVTAAQAALDKQASNGDIVGSV